MLKLGQRIKFDDKITRCEKQGAGDAPAARWIHALLGLVYFALVACNTTAPSLPPSITPSSTLTPVSSHQSPISNLRVGWAYEAYPDASFEKMRDDFAMMRANGANAVWLGHNNPGQVNADKVEPGISYAVYAALQNKNDALHADARAMADAVKRALDAARATKMQVVLPIGYQIQMGDAWNEKYPNDLRLTFEGTPLNLYHSGYTASPYSSQYRADITRYYEWVEREFVEPYRDVIVMLSLADEPMGGDYSVAAKNTFAERYGKTMDALSQNEMWKIGEFESGVIADYATWSANEWARINPQLPTTMSFHGGETARRVWGLPDIEKLFSQTPDNFIVTFDAYLHDDLATKPATPDQAAQLKLFLTTIGNYSRVYEKPIALWGGVNAWGLAQESDAPLGISDAVTNLLLLYDLPARVGGKVWGIFAWNYNVKQQGLENYSRPTTYDLRAMQIAVERAFPVLRTRQVQPQPPDIAIVVSQRALYEALEESRAADTPPNWFDATPFARALADRNAIFVSSDKTVNEAREALYFIVAAQAADLDDEMLDFLRAQFDEGKIILTSDALLAQRWNVPNERWEEGLNRLPNNGETLYIFDVE
ncbi:MAG: hypothetical protein B6D41_12200 [Chloroflexi bacterium UTCFX4]|nr:MAG: hypothetical protein B6D41_12200 [Chloroflexi bacterium UTCFX4]